MGLGVGRGIDDMIDRRVDKHYQLSRSGRPFCSMKAERTSHLLSLLLLFQEVVKSLLRFGSQEFGVLDVNVGWLFELTRNFVEEFR
jgi:hypothetical protein